MHRPSLRPVYRVRWFAAVAAAIVASAMVLTACDSGGSSSNAAKHSPGTTEATDATTPSDGSNPDAQATATEPVGALAAVADYLKSQGYEYAGDCATAVLPRDKGKWCSTLVSSDAVAGTETYAVGPVGEKSQKTITVKRRGVVRLTPGYQVGVADGTVGQPQQLTREQLEADAFITGNLLLDQTAGIGAGLSDLPAGAPATVPGTPGTGGNGDGGTGGTGGGVPPTTPGGGGLPQYPANGVIVVDNPTVDIGGQVQFKGSGCRPDETLQVLFDGHPIGSITSDPQGNFAASIGIPPGTAPGAHLLTVRGSDCVFNATIMVAGNHLAFTGSSNHTGTYVLAGIAAVVAGFVLVVGSHRRRKGVRGRSSPPGVL